MEKKYSNLMSDIKRGNTNYVSGDSRNNCEDEKASFRNQLNNFKSEGENSPPYFDSKQVWILERGLTISSKYAENSSSFERQEFESNIKVLSEKVNELEQYSDYIKSEKDDEIALLKSQISGLQKERSEIITQKSIFEEQYKSSESEKQRIERKYLDKIAEIQLEYDQEVVSLKSTNGELTELLRAKIKEDEGNSEIIVNLDGSITKVLKPQAQSKSELIKLNALMEQ